MLSETLNELDRRVAIAEHASESMRAQIQELLGQAAHQKRSMRRNSLLGLAILVLIGFVSRTSETNAQAGPQVMTVKAPFVVVDAAGRPLMRVDDKNKIGMSGIYVFNLPFAIMGKK